MGKITVKHYLNKDLNPRIKDNQKTYPVYVQVIVLTKNLKFKSNGVYFDYLSDVNIQNDNILNILDIERKDIERVVGGMLENNRTDLITSKNICFYTQSINSLIDNNICKLFIEERGDKFLPEIFMYETYSHIKELIYFFNNGLPIYDISERVRYCFDALNVLNNLFLHRDFLVYDLFYGDKFDLIVSELNMYTTFEPKETEKLINAIQDLVKL